MIVRSPQFSKLKKLCKICKLGRVKHLPMVYSLSNIYANSFFWKKTVLIQLIVEDVVTF